MASRIIGSGGYLPKKIVTNHDLSELVDTNDEWIVTRTGISQRHIAADDELASSMAHQASINAINNAKVNANDIGLIVVCTTTPDNSFPSTASKLQHMLGIKNIPVFDIQAVCSGFVYGLEVVDNFINSGKYNNVLLVAAEKMSALQDWKDRSTCVLFGDGAGAVIVQKNNESNSGIIDTIIGADGSLYNSLYTDGGIGSSKSSGCVQMNGREIFKNAVEKMPESVLEIMQRNNLTIDDVDYIIPHQANIRIINNMAGRLGVDHEKIVTTIANHANCSAASIPLALNNLNESGRLKQGDKIIFTAFGAGATWGSSYIIW